MPTRQTKRKLKSKRPKTTPKRRRGRVHAICAKCYRASELQRESIPVPLPMCFDKERCCFCERLTPDGIYVRTLRPPRRSCCKPGHRYPTHGSLGDPEDGHYRGQRLVAYRIAHSREEPPLKEVDKW